MNLKGVVITSLRTFLHTRVPTSVLPLSNKVVLSVKLNLFTTTETFLKTDLLLTAMSITSCSTERS